MKPFLALFAISVISFSCKEKPTLEKAADKNYYLEFVNEGKPGTSEWADYAGAIRLIKRNLFGARYYYGTSPHADKWVTPIGEDDSVTVTKLDEHFPTTHHFRDISEYKSSDVDAEKIVITLRTRDKNKLYNFDFHSYRKNGGTEWQSVFDPGNFRFPNPHPEAPDKDLSGWMSDFIVKLTFK